MRRLLTGPTILAVALTTAACGGGSHSGQAATTTSHPASTSAGTTVGAGSGAAGTSVTPPAAITSGPVRATLHAQGHSPVIGANWFYTVTARDASGHPLAGTVFSEFAFAGQVVGHETPATHRLKHGQVHDVIQFPARTLGIPVTFQTVIHTRLGTVTLGWPVKAVK